MKLEEPVNKLIDTIRGAIGTLYEPTKIRRLTAAKSYEIEEIAKAIRNNSDMPIIYNSEGGVIIDSSDYHEIAKRAGQRLLFQEITKQQNIDAVVSKAHKELADESLVTSDPVCNDWVLRFFNSVGEVSDEKMQLIWAKVLSGEVKKPGSFSLRTLHVLSTLSSQEADSLKRIAPFSLSMTGINCVYESSQYFRDALPLHHIAELYDCNILADNHSMSYSGKVSEPNVLMFSENTALVINEPGRYTAHIYRFTTVGSELLRLISIEPDEEYILEVFKDMRTNNPLLSLSAHRIKKRDGRVMSLDDEDVLPIAGNNAEEWSSFRRVGH